LWINQPLSNDTKTRFTSALARMGHNGGIFYTSSLSGVQGERRVVTEEEENEEEEYTEYENEDPWLEKLGDYSSVWDD
jgi:hypothetical protein